MLLNRHFFKPRNVGGNANRHPSKMENLISKETEADLTKLGIYQIVGGALGLLFIVWNIYRTEFFTGLVILIYFFVLLFFAYSIFCGVLCLKPKKNALTHSLINQILQLIGFAFMGIAYKYIAGVYFTVGLDLTDAIQVGFGAGFSKLNFTFNIDPDRLEVDFNLIAFILIYWIDKLMRKIKEEAAIRQASSIGDS